MQSLVLIRNFVFLIILLLFFTSCSQKTNNLQEHISEESKRKVHSLIEKYNATIIDQDLKSSFAYQLQKAINDRAGKNVLFNAFLKDIYFVNGRYLVELKHFSNDKLTFLLVFSLELLG